MATSALTLCANCPPRWSNASHLSDPPTIKRRLFSFQNAPSAAERLCELVDFESSTIRIHRFSANVSIRCASPSISRRCSRRWFSDMPILSAMIATERIFHALCIPEKFVSERRSFFPPPKTISSPSVYTLGVISTFQENIARLSGFFHKSPSPRTKSSTCRFTATSSLVWCTRFIFASTYSCKSRCQFKWSVCKFVKIV